MYSIVALSCMHVMCMYPYMYPMYVCNVRVCCQYVCLYVGIGVATCKVSITVLQREDATSIHILIQCNAIGNDSGLHDTYILSGGVVQSSDFWR